MKICIWCTKIFDLGGTKRVVTLLANELVKEHDVTIMVYQDRFKEDRNMYHMSEDIKVDFIDNNEFVNRHHTPAFCWRYLVQKLNAKYGIFNKEKYNDILADAIFPKKTREKWVKYLNEQNYDIIITTASLSLRLGMLAPELNAKTIGWQHNCYAGYLDVPKNIIIEMEQMKNYPPEKMVLITTGSQGESMAALSRMAADVHRKVTIQPNDTIIFSSNPIPGNEKSVSRVINELSSKGAEVIFQDAHVSGHACQEELKLIYSLVKPKYAIPVHGEYRHLKANAEVAKSLGIPKENVFIIQSGDVLELCDDSAEVVDKVHTGAILVDGLGVGDVGNIVLRDRQHLAEDGIIIVVLTLERRTNRLLAGPDIVSRGFVYVRESEELMDDARRAVSEAVDKCLSGRHTDWNKIKLVIRDSMNDYIWKKTKRKPMVIPIIMDVDV